MKKDRLGNVIVDDCRLTHVQAPIAGKDAVKLEFLYNTISLKSNAFYAGGKKYEYSGWSSRHGRSHCATNARIKTAYKDLIVQGHSGISSHVINLIKFVYKYQDNLTQRSVLAEYIGEVERLIDVLNTETEIKVWRSVYKNARTTKQT